MGRISEPVLDRIDLHIEIPAIRHRELASKDVGESSQEIRGRVVSERERFSGKDLLLT